MVIPADKITPEEILEALRTHYAESIFITDGYGNVIYVNEVGAKRLGSSIDKIEGKNVQSLMSGGLYERSTSIIAIETKEPAIATLNPGKENSTISNSIPVLDEDGNVTMVVTNNMSVEHSRDWEAIIMKERKLTEKLKRELDSIRQYNKPDILAESPRMREIYANVDIIAPTDSNIVIAGESGTGKDVMARYIHNKSNRKDEAFISVNCAAIPDNLLESELFGYEPGAFTGALGKGKIGLFEAASGGTLFLDEIGEMPLTLQSKLLRALENHEVRRVGGIKPIPIDARIVCASNHDLKVLVQENKFREDLYYRLNVFTIEMPPLRERRQDIIPLATKFLDALNSKYGTDKHFSNLTIDTMLKHQWPGNIRELKNVVERTFVVAKGDEILFTPMPYADFNQSKSTDYSSADIRIDYTLKEYVDMVERRYITSVIKSCDGSVAKAAERLGVHRSVIYRKLGKDKKEMD